MPKTNTDKAETPKKPLKGKKGVKGKGKKGQDPGKQGQDPGKQEVPKNAFTKAFEKQLFGGGQTEGSSDHDEEEAQNVNALDDAINQLNQFEAQTEAGFQNNRILTEKKNSQSNHTNANPNPYPENLTLAQILDIGVRQKKQREAALKKEKEAGDGNIQIGSLPENLGIFQGNLDETELSKMFDQIQELQNQNMDLKKKCHKYKMQVSIIPEMRDELTKMRIQLSQVEQGLTGKKLQVGQSSRDGDDISFGKNVNDQVGMQGPISRTQMTYQQLNKILDVMEEKNYGLVKENIDLKEQISELKEQVIKRNNFIEGLRSDIKVNIMDLKYLYQKLNHGQEIVNIREPELTGKFLISQIDHLIDEKLANIKDCYERGILQEQRMNGMRDQILNLQSVIERNQDVVVHQSARLQTLEDVNKNLKHDVTVKSEAERLLDGFKAGVKSKLLTIRGKIDGDTRNLYHDLGVEQLLDWITERTHLMVSNERTLRSHIESMSSELHRKTNELEQIRSGNLIPRSLPSEERARLQEHIAKLEEMLENRNRLAAATGSYGAQSHRQVEATGGLDQEIVDAFIYQLLHKIKTLIFQKNYMKVENQSLTDKLQKLEIELRSLAPTRTYLRSRACLRLKKVVQSMIFINRLKRANAAQYGEVNTRKRAADRLSDNWGQFKAIWDHEIRHNIKVHSSADRLLQKFTPWPLILKELPRRFYNNEALELIDSLKVRFGDLTHRATESRYQAEQQAQRLRSIEHDRFSYYQQQPRSDMVQEDIIARQRGTIRDLESKLEEMRLGYEQKLRYLRQDLDMKKHQIDNMRSLIQVTEHNSIEEDTGLNVRKVIPIKVGGGYLLPSENPKLYAEKLKLLQESEHPPIKVGGGYLLHNDDPKAYEEYARLNKEQ